MEINRERYENLKVVGEKVARSQREEVLIKFFDTIDEEREGTQFKPINRRAYSIKLNTAFKSLWDLERFYAECVDYPGPFGVRFFGGFKEQAWKSNCK